MTKHIIAIADPHFSEQAINKYRLDFWLHELPRIIEARKPEALLILGDLTDAKDRHAAWLVNAIVTALDQLAEITTVYVLMGNHDYAHEGQPFFEFIHRISMLNWIGTPTEVTLLGKPMLMLPHTHDHVKDWAPYAKRFDKFNAIFTHQLYEGAVNHASVMSGISPNVFPPKARVFSGDVHPPQRIANIEYVGCPYTINFGDDFVPRMLRITVKDATTIGLGAFTQKRVLQAESVKHLAKQLKEVGDHDIARVTLECDSMADWPDLQRAARELLDKHGVQYQLLPSVLKRNMRKRVRVNLTETDDDLVKAFAKRHKLDPATEAAGLKLCKE